MTDALRQASEVWAQELSATISAFLGKPCAFHVEAVGSRFEVTETKERSGLPLTIGGEQFLTLRVKYQCMWDSKNTFLAMHTSDFDVYAGSKTNGEPLFRYNYVRSPTGRIPGAHIHVHGQRDAYTHVVSSAGRQTNRSKRNAKRSPGEAPTLKEFHFPVGGSRFRPCLEDLLEAMHDEFGLDTGPDWDQALKQARAKWRRTQVRVVTRDAPDEAAETLRKLGYGVTPPDESPSENTDRLTAL